MFPGSGFCYKLMYAIGFALMMVYSVKCSGRYRVPKKTAVVLTLLTYVFGVTGALAMGRIYTAISEKVTGEGSSKVAIFGAVIFCPLLLLAVFGLQALFFKKECSFRKQMDLLTPGIFMILTCAKFGCFLEGCCYGVACDFGVYNPQAGMKVFPVQIFETACMIAVLLLARVIEKRKGFVSGMKYPVTAMMYCAIRFGWEYLRYYGDDRMRRLVWGMTFWQACCIAVFLASAGIVAWLAGSERLRKKASA